MFKPLSEFLAERYLKQFLKGPLLMFIMTFLGLGVIIFTGYRIQAALRRMWPDEPLPTYSQQLQRLDGVQQSLKDLSDFVSQQRVRLQESEQVVSKLQEEKQRIEPLVQADRKVVEAVFQLQEQRTAAAVARERWIGFGLGVGASFLASFMYALVVLAYRKARKNDSGQDT